MVFKPKGGMVVRNADAASEDDVEPIKRTFRTDGRSTLPNRFFLSAHSLRDC